ncbi:MAG: hypothetical protein B9S34_06730 [Opitutia bacterium Tous-C1TDCM]|nr:MAG: hypothetical protein B9S34_06730 [Opitutae bacterium Tous-C1TDCM]
MSSDPAKTAQEREKLRRTVLILAPVLILAGIAILLFLERMPLPLRLLTGLGDIVVGLVLLVLLKQKYFEK